jgi:ElaB/YqjD/DUF883 family membrane-anchored ribosome-binding protein
MGYRQHIDDIADSASQTFGDVVGGVSRAAHQMGRDGRALRRDFAKRADALRDEAGSSVRRVRGDAHDAQIAVVRAAQRLNADVGGLTRGRPIAMLLTAAAFGLAVGWLASR